MSYKDHEVTAVRKTNYDMLWHVCYIIPTSYGRSAYETYDRVTRAVALRVATRMEKKQRA